MIRNKLYSTGSIIIGETAFIHEGDFEYLNKLIHSMSEENIDMIKFQVLINKDDYMENNHPFYNDLDKYIFSEVEWGEIIEKSYKLGLQVIITAIDISALDLVSEYIHYISAIEIHPSCMMNPNLLREAKKISMQNQTPLLVGISGYTVDEIDDMIGFLKTDNKENNLFLVYGFQNYPTNFSDVNLKKMKAYEARFGLKCIYADHSRHDDPCKSTSISAAAALGCNIQEIHVCLEEGVERTDYITSVSPIHLKGYRKQISEIINLIGNGDFSLSSGEKKYSKTFKIVPIYKGNFKKGHVLCDSDIDFKRLSSFKNKHGFKITYKGLKLSMDVELGEEFDWNNIQEER